MWVGLGCVYHVCDEEAEEAEEQHDRGSRGGRWSPREAARDTPAPSSLTGCHSGCGCRCSRG